MRRNTNRAAGKLITFSGGGPNRPIAMLCTHCIWTIDATRNSSWPVLSPTLITPLWAILRDGDARTAMDIIEAQPNQDKLIVQCDIGQNPAAKSVISSRGFDDPLQIYHVKVDSSQADGFALDAQGQQPLGARHLISWFDNHLAKLQPGEKPEEGVYGSPYVPDRILLRHDPARYSTEMHGALDWEQVGQAASSAESLFERRGGDGDALMDMSADESVAIALMLQLWAADQHRPITQRSLPFDRARSPSRNLHV